MASKVGSILLFLLLAASFVTAAKVLMAPLLTPAPVIYPEPAVKELELSSAGSVNCSPTTVQACVVE